MSTLLKADRMKLRIINLLFLLLSFSIVMNAQYYSFSDHVKKADEYYSLKSYLLALEQYNEASKQKGKLKKNSLYNYADAAYQLNSLSLAEGLFMEYLENDKIDNGHEVLLKLIKIRQKQERYEEAILDCNIYLSEYEELSITKTQEVNQLKESCQWALSYTESDMVDSVRNMKEINSEFSEMSPYLFNDSLYFNALNVEASVEKGKSFVSRIYKEPKQRIEIDGIADEKFISHPSFSTGSKYFMYTVCDYNEAYEIVCDIYFSVMGPENSVGVTRKMTAPVNDDSYSDTHPVLVELDTTMHLYFASNRPGGKGGFDIYRAVLSNDFIVQDLKNLVDVNTPGDEFSPYLDFNTNNLYFSSSGRPGFGGFDVFRIDLDKDEMPENVGAKINSSYNDLYFRMNENGSVVYFTSNRPGSAFLDSQFESCCYDIYTAEVTECSINLLALIYDDSNNQMLNGAQFSVVDAETRDTVYSDSSDENMFEVELECDKAYEIITVKEGYDISNIDFKPANFSYGQENEIIRKIYLTPSIYDLNLSVFSKDTNLPLDSLDFKLTNLSTQEEDIVLKHPSSKIQFKLLPGTDYRIDVSRQGYRDTFEIFNSGNTVAVIDKKLYLEEQEIIKQAKVSLAEAIPVALYFDHDSPKQADSLHQSAVNYSSSFDNYYEKRGRYVYNYVSRYSGSRQDRARREISQFFDNEVKGGFEKYDLFKNQLLLVLESGQKVNVYLRGYASPIALDEYNQALGRRRVDSIRQEFDDWNGGALLPYIESGQLIVTERSFGEETSPLDVSDDPSKPYESIYSPGASRERRVEIDEINFNDEN